MRDLLGWTCLLIPRGGKVKDRRLRSQMLLNIMCALNPENAARSLLWMMWNTKWERIVLEFFSGSWIIEEEFFSHNDIPCSCCSSFTGTQVFRLACIFVILKWTCIVSWKDFVYFDFVYFVFQVQHNIKNSGTSARFSDGAFCVCIGL